MFSASEKSSCFELWSTNQVPPQQAKQIRPKTPASRIASFESGFRRGGRWLVAGSGELAIICSWFISRSKVEAAFFPACGPVHCGCLTHSLSAHFR